MDRTRTILFLLLAIAAGSVRSQLHCGSVTIIPTGSSNPVFTFDEFRDYEGGVILSNVAQMRLTVEDQAVPDPACSWFLTVVVDNNPSAGTPAPEWEELASYGVGTGSNPLIDVLEVRVRNSCRTSPLDGTFVTMSNHGDLLDIIEPLLPVTPAGSCTTHVNGPGSYLTHPGEYVFTLDLRVRPGFVFDPGIYTLNLRFHLEENP